MAENLTELLEKLRDVTQKLKEVTSPEGLREVSDAAILSLKEIKVLYETINKLEASGVSQLEDISNEQKNWYNEALKTKDVLDQIILEGADRQLEKLRGINIEEQRSTKQYVERLKMLQRSNKLNVAEAATDKLRLYYETAGTKQVAQRLKYIQSLSSLESMKGGLGEATTGLLSQSIGRIAGSIGASGTITAGTAALGGALFGAGILTLGMKASLDQLKDRTEGYSVIIGSSTESLAKVTKQAKFYSMIVATAGQEFAMTTDEVKRAHGILASNLTFKTKDFFGSMDYSTKSLRGIRRFATSMGISYDEAAETSVLLTNVQRKLYGTTVAEERATKDSVRTFYNLNKAAKLTGIALPALNKATMSAVSATSEYTTSADSVSRAMVKLLTQKGPVAPVTAEQAARDVSAIANAVINMPLASKMLAMPKAGLGAGIAMMRMGPDELRESVRGMLGGALTFRSGESDASKQLKLLLAGTMTGVQNYRLLYQTLDEGMAAQIKASRLELEQAEREMLSRDKYQKDTQGWTINFARVIITLLTDIKNMIAQIGT